MNFRKYLKIIIFLSILASFNLSGPSYALEIFIYRPDLDKMPLSKEKKIRIHGEFFGQLQLPGTFPSYNDLSGLEDRWNYGFQNLIYITEKTTFLAQLLAHDDSHSRTKFDWHFSLRHSLFENLVLIISHDSNHDSDHKSLVEGRRFYVNRNCLGLGFPFRTDRFYIEPFACYFLNNTRDRVHLDLSGQDTRQEYGLRFGMWLGGRVGFHLQLISQSDRLFSIGKAALADLIIRIKLLDWFELSTGGSFWQDIKESPLGNRKKFYKLLWGIALPF